MSTKGHVYVFFQGGEITSMFSSAKSGISRLMMEDRTLFDDFGEEVDFREATKLLQNGVEVRCCRTEAGVFIYSVRQFLVQ